MRKKVVILLGILLLITLSIGISYASWVFGGTQKDFNTLGSKCFELTMMNESEGITLEKVYPITDQEGLELTGYTFTIKNTCNTYATYEVNLEDILNEEVKPLPNEYIKVSINDGTPENLNKLEAKEPTIENAEVSFELTSGSLAPDSEATYTVKLWLDEETPAIEEVMNATFESKVTIGAGYIEEEELANEIQISYESTTESINNQQEDFVIRGTSEKYNLTEYSIDNSHWSRIESPSKEVEIPYTFTEEGTYNFYIKDEVGNISNVEIETTKLDQSAPNLEVNNELENWGTKDSIHIQATDKGIGISAYSISQVEGEYNWIEIDSTSSYEITIEINENGTYYVSLKDALDQITTRSIVIDKIDNTVPSMTSIEIKNVTPTGYDVYVYGVEDAGSGVSTVRFPTWTTNNGQDDLLEDWQTNEASKGQVEEDGTTWVYRVNTTDHQNESGEYTTQVYLYDNAGNTTFYEETVTVPNVEITYDANYYSTNLWKDTLTLSTYNSAGTKPTNSTLVADAMIPSGKYISFTMPSGTDGGPYYRGSVLTEGKTYTWSVYIKASKNMQMKIGQEQNGLQNVNVTTSWQKFTYTFTANSGQYHAFVFYLVNGSVWNSGDVISVHSLEIMEGTPNHTKVSKAYNTELGTLSTLSRTGYTFQGWYTDPMVGNKIDSTTKVPSQNTTYYAHWKDTTNPSVSFGINSSTSGSNGWYKALSIKATTSDSGSGVSSAKYCTTTSSSCTPGTNLSLSNNVGTITLGTNSAAQRVCVSVTDNAGRSTTSCSGTYKVDTANPTAKISATVKQNSIVVSANGSSDSGSGNKTYQYRLDNGQWYSSTSTSYTFSNVSVGSHTVYVQVVDNSGRTSSAVNAKGTIASDNIIYDSGSANYPYQVKIQSDALSGYDVFFRSSYIYFNRDYNKTLTFTTAISNNYRYMKITARALVTSSRNCNAAQFGLQSQVSVQAVGYPNNIIARYGIIDDGAGKLTSYNSYTTFTLDLGSVTTSRYYPFLHNCDTNYYIQKIWLTNTP